jgi:type IV pilus assembly protein PilC
MPRYFFKARNAAGGLVEGTRNTGSEKELVALLRNEGLIVFSASVAKEKVSRAVARGKNLKKGRAIRYQDIAIFCRQMATLINAGVSILDAIEDVADMVSSQRFQKIILSIATDIREGSSFSDAMRKHHKIFGKVFVALVATGEKSGQLAKVMTDLATYQENVIKLRRKVKAASAYPIFVGSFFGIVLIGLVLFIIPKFKAMFASFGAQLPLPTRIIMGISDFAMHNMLILFLLVAGAVAGFIMTNRTTPGKLLFDKFKLTMPLIGEIITKIAYARFFQTLSTLIISGNDIITSLDIAAQTTDNLYMEGIITSIRTKVTEGSTLSAEFAASAFFPKMVVRMTAIGEKSGKIDEMFWKLSNYYNDEVDAIVAVMSSIIEPVLIVALGLIVGIVVITMYLPIFNMAAAIISKQ